MSQRILKTVLLSIFCLIPVLIDWFQWDIVDRLSARYNGLIAGLFYYLATGIRVITLLILVIIVIRKILQLKQKDIKNKILIFIPTVIFLLTVLLQFVFPFTEIYTGIEYHFNNTRREKIVSMLSGKTTMELSQTNVDTYILPFNLRLASQNAKVTTERDDNELKVLFYAHRGIIKNSAIIYVSTGEEVENGDFGIKYSKIKSIDSNWYVVEHYSMHQN